MHTPRKRTTLLSAIAIGVVATMGLGFALWTETLNVDATVSTGELSAVFALPVATDDDGGQADGTCTAIADGNSLSVKLDNAYPGYSCDIATPIFNNGTVDAVITEAGFQEDPAIQDDKISITRVADGIGSYPNGQTTTGPTYRVAVNRTATETHVNEKALYTIGASIDFANATP